MKHDLLYEGLRHVLKPWPINFTYMTRTTKMITARPFCWGEFVGSSCRPPQLSVPRPGGIAVLHQQVFAKDRLQGCSPKVSGQLNGKYHHWTATTDWTIMFFFAIVRWCCYSICYINHLCYSIYLIHHRKTIYSYHSWLIFELCQNNKSPVVSWSASCPPEW